MKSCRTLTFTHHERAYDALDLVAMTLGHPRAYEMSYDWPNQRFGVTFAATTGAAVETLLSANKVAFTASSGTWTPETPGASLDDGFYTAEEYEAVLSAIEAEFA